MILPFAILILSVSGCRADPQRAAIKDTYGTHTDDALWCRRIASDYNPNGTSHLSDSDKARLQILMQTPSNVASDANGVLVAYANQDPALKKWLTEQVPNLLNASSPVLRRNGVNLVKWYKLAGFDDKLLMIKSELQAKSELDPNEQLLLESVTALLSSRSD